MFLMECRNAIAVCRRKRVVRFQCQMLTSKLDIHWHNSFSAQHLISFDVARAEIAKTRDIFGADKHAPERDRKANLVAFPFAVGFDHCPVSDSPQLWRAN